MAHWFVAQTVSVSELIFTALQQSNTYQVSNYFRFAIIMLYTVIKISKVFNPVKSSNNVSADLDFVQFEIHKW